MNQPMFMPMNDFVSKLVTGELDMIHPIPVQTRGGWVNHEAFPMYVNHIADRENVPRLALYRTIQDAVHKGFLQRMNRSDIFRNKVESVCKEWDPECDATTLFEDRVTLPYDMKYHKRERQRMIDLMKRLQEMERNLENGGDRSEMEDFMGECDDCIRRVDTQEKLLEENCDEYEPNHVKIWKDLSWRPHSFYRSHATDHYDPKYANFAEKQIRRYIPENIQRVFENGINISHFMERENVRLRQELRECRDKVTELHKRVSWLHSNLPRESKGAFMKWFDPSDSSEEDESDTEDLETQLQDFLKRPEQDSEQPETQEETKEEEDEQEEEQEEEEQEEEEQEEEQDQQEPEEEEDPEWARNEGQLGGNFYLNMSDKTNKNSKGFAFF